eukprot:TRINITY_DN18115_c0_g1_i1.p1 TRINITY_DN18115_c0_g1~~TRINITY_DN18115_c0_g1_i1.p1  ORF type:complete len:265 (-),score=65.87 TRINITY_DN18115_c0_g1_i1:57-851(-)
MLLQNAARTLLSYSKTLTGPLKPALWGQQRMFFQHSLRTLLPRSPFGQLTKMNFSTAKQVFEKKLPLSDTSRQLMSKIFQRSQLILLFSVPLAMCRVSHRDRTIYELISSFYLPLHAVKGMSLVVEDYVPMAYRRVALRSMVGIGALVGLGMIKMIVKDEGPTKFFLSMFNEKYAKPDPTRAERKELRKAKKAECQAKMDACVQARKDKKLRKKQAKKDKKQAKKDKIVLKKQVKKEHKIEKRKVKKQKRQEKLEKKKLENPSS